MQKVIKNSEKHPVYQKHQQPYARSPKFSKYFSLLSTTKHIIFNLIENYLEDEKIRRL